VGYYGSALQALTGLKTTLRVGQGKRYLINHCQITVATYLWRRLVYNNEGQAHVEGKNIALKYQQEAAMSAEGKRTESI
jgi:hypothetical protein